MTFPKIAVIGGTMMADLFRQHGEVEDHVADTPYGVQVHYSTVRDRGVEFFFVSRHNATGRFCIAHRLDHRPYMRFLTNDLGVTHILSTSAVGGIATRIPMRHGSLIAPSDYRDFTAGIWTFETEEYTHPTAFNRPSQDPFCHHLRLLLDARVIGEPAKLAVAVRGPRYETRTEAEAFDQLGMDLLGMQTCVPEAVLAREAGIHYQPVCITTDLPLEEAEVSGKDVERIVRESQPLLREIFLEAFHSLKSQDIDGWSCCCTRVPSVFDLVPGLRMAV